MLSRIVTSALAQVSGVPLSWFLAILQARYLLAAAWATLACQAIVVTIMRLVSAPPCDYLVSHLRSFYTSLLV